ncbi:guanitoxin biosynthesis L-enduracididine beta-hydroxylase GntD [Dactylosporangium sp. NPDC005555]|uniref:guanitoxin biosynthesis L-enduracididine beta-hydroxylase GntD n=1 Tax=Dactylosporangium sp. NPDC005555 TaxID=3154889 RepID=UPI0033AB80EA
MTDREADQLHLLATRIAATYGASDDPDLLRELPLLTAGIPLRIRRALRQFALGEAAGFFMLRGHRIDDDRIGPTPAHWRNRRDHPELPEEILVLLYAALLGEPFGWATQQDGNLVNDIFPIRENESQRLGTGSQVRLTLHTEDGFHPYRADHIILGALRNPDRVPTTVAELDVTALSDDERRVLGEDRFVILPDTSHLPRNNSMAGAAETFASIDALRCDEQRISVLHGSPTRPFLRLDESYMTAVPGDTEAAEALAHAVALLHTRAEVCVLDAGDFLFLDNQRVVHGRSPFRSRYDGTDRWFKRVNVSRDLTKSSDMRAAGSRLIG